MTETLQLAEDKTTSAVSKWNLKFEQKHWGAYIELLHHKINQELEEPVEITEEHKEIFKDPHSGDMLHYEVTAELLDIDCDTWKKKAIRFVNVEEEDIVCSKCGFVPDSKDGRGLNAHKGWHNREGVLH